MIIEGQFIFHLEKIRRHFDYKIYVETDDDIRLARMILKENHYLQESCSAMKSFFWIYEYVIKPCFQNYIETSKKYAHLILPNFEFDASLDLKVTTILDFMVNNLENATKK